MYEGVVLVQGATAADLYNRAKTYYLKTFNNANRVIEVDQPNQQVSGRGVFLFMENRKPGIFNT